MVGALDKSPDVASRRGQLVALCRPLPGAEAVRAGARDLVFKVGGRIFAYYVEDHHRDGRVALLCKALPGESGRLVRENPGRYFVPPHVGPKGWVGIRLDSPRMSWRAVKNAFFVAYVLRCSDPPRRPPRERGSHASRGPARPRGRARG